MLDVLQMVTGIYMVYALREMNPSRCVYTEFKAMFEVKWLRRTGRML